MRGASLLKALKLLVGILLLPLTGCSGCEDVTKLTRVCTAQQRPCVDDSSSRLTFSIVSEEAVESLSIGRCQVGRTQCKGFEVCPEDQPNCDEQYDIICVGYVAPTEEVCGDWLDSDCDGEKDNGFDLDGDGFLDRSKTTPSGHPCGWDCDDSDPSVHPNAL